ncbi:MAG: RcpC/CpaB family pilus assembly protein [Solirubrobacterales bacterium]
MNRRRRAVALFVAACLCAVGAITVAERQGRLAREPFGALREVVVAERALPARRTIDAASDRPAVSIRRVPERFAPPDAVRALEEVAGLVPAVELPAGSYVLASQLRAPGSSRPSRPRAGRGRSPVEVRVSGGAALGRLKAGSRVDVIVASEAAGDSTTRIAQRDVRLLGLDPAGETAAGDGDDEPPPDSGAGTLGEWVAVLALTSAQAVELIDAESFARQIRLLPRAERR